MSAEVIALMDIVFGGEHSEDDGRIAQRSTTKAGRSP
jgi:hypothetical protein